MGLGSTWNLTTSKTKKRWEDNPPSVLWFESMRAQSSLGRTGRNQAILERSTTAEATITAEPASAAATAAAATATAEPTATA